MAAAFSGTTLGRTVLGSAVLGGVLLGGVLLGGCSNAPRTPAPPVTTAAPNVEPQSTASPSSQGGATHHLSTLPSGIRRIDIVDQQRYWASRNFHRLTPIIRVSLPSPTLDVAVYLRLPEQGAIELSPPKEGMRRLQWPPGTEADRVTYIRHRDAQPGVMTVADVRGSRIDAQGRERFHVYRPASGALHAKLIGYEWQRSDRDQRERAHALVLRHVSRTPRANTTRPPDADYLQGFTQLMSCERCHVPDKTPAESPYSWLPLWPTDSVGWYVPQSVMRHRAELSTTADFHDPNAADRFVSGSCRDDKARLHQSGAVSWYSCPDGGMPMGSSDLRAGLAASHDYARAVCASRSWLLSRMSAPARAHFSDMAGACNLTAADLAAP